MKPEEGTSVEKFGTDPLSLGCLWGRTSALQPGLGAHFSEPGTEWEAGDLRLPRCVLESKAVHSIPETLGYEKTA